MRSTSLSTTVYNNIIVPVVLYGCATWSVTVREELGLKVPENVGPKMEEVMGDLGKLYNGKSCDLHCLPCR